ncbi:MAG: hypothetical protein JOZ51_11790 [Chloroflexi bacterium]|nr:hypothetical protein [Chloroflexota bacterium]
MHALYNGELAQLGERGTLAVLDAARQWDFASTLRDGGVVVFPHTNPFDSGLHTAAAVNGCLDSGADRVIVISVLHAFTQEMEDARIRVAAGDDPANYPFWGIQGSGLAGRDEWRGDHALLCFRHFWAAETKRRGIKGPDLIERYPYLAGGKPERLPGIDELARLAENAVIVSTADSLHHGIGYGDTPEQSYEPDDEGLAFARRTIEEGIEILSRGDYPGYMRHCLRAKSDARDAGTVFRYVAGPLQGRIVDLKYSDATELYRQPAPTWVAAALVEWQAAQSAN